MLKINWSHYCFIFHDNDNINNNLTNFSIQELLKITQFLILT